MSLADDIINGSYSKKKKNQIDSNTLADDIINGTYKRNTVNTDLAPVAKEENKNFLQEIFQKSKAFDDGYNIGDVTKTILGTTADVGLGAVQGLANISEGISDLIWHGVAQVKEWQGDTEKAKQIRKIATENTLRDLIDKPRNAVNNYSVIGNSGDKVSESLGYIAGLWATSYLGGALGGTLGKGSSAAMKIGSEIASNATMFSSATGSALSEAYSKDEITDAQAWSKAIGSGLIETATEKLFGLFGTSGLDTGIANAISARISSGAGKLLARVGVQATGEAVEEFLSYAGGQLLDDAIDKVSNGKGAKLSEDWNWEEVGEQMATAFISSAILGAGTNATEIADVKNTENISLKEAINKAGFNADIQAQAENLESDINRLNKKLNKTTDANVKIQLQEELNSKGKQLNALLKNNNIAPINNESQIQGLQEEIAKSEQELAQTEDARAKQIIQEKIDNLNAELNDVNTQIIQLEQSDNSRINDFRQSINEIGLQDNEHTRKLIDVSEGIMNRMDNVSIKYNTNIQTANNQIADGKVTVKDGQILMEVNPNSNKAMEYLMTHELIHPYVTNDMRAMIKTFAENKNNTLFNEAIKEAQQKYGTTDITDEVVADAGAQLFGNQEFLNQVATEKPGMLKQIYNKIVSMLNKITGYSNEKLMLRDFKTKIENAIRNNDITMEDGSENYLIAGKQGLDDSLAKTSRFNKIYPKLKELYNSYDRALEMKADKISNKKIIEETGWFQDKNGDWKFEFPDTGIEFKQPLEIGIKYDLEDAIDHDILFTIYPEFKKYKIMVDSNLKNGTNASFNRKSNVIRISPNLTTKNAKGTILHEIQHAIQKAEGFESGASIGKYKSGKAYYESLGEAEADNVKQRYLKNSYDSMPISAKKNPKHRSYDSYMKNRTTVDKLKDFIYTASGGVMLNGQTSKKINTEIQGLDGKNGIQEVGGKNLEDSNKSSFSLPTSDKYNQFIKETFDFGEDGTKTYGKDILPVANNQNNSELKVDNNMPLPINAALKDTSIETQEKEKVAKILSEAPTKENRDQRLWAKMKAALLDKGAVFEDLAIKTKNRELMGKWDSMLMSQQKAQHAMLNGIGEIDALNGTKNMQSKSLNDIWAQVETADKVQEFNEYLYHKHNISRMTLDERFGLENKPVFSEGVTAEISQKYVNELEENNPEFIEWANDVYDYNKALLNEMVKSGVVSEDTANRFGEMYPNYVPITRANVKGNAINVPLDTNRTGINAPLKQAKGGNQDIIPLKDTMAKRTLQTYKAIDKNNFGIELKNTLNSVVENQSSNIEDILNNFDNQEELLQEGKNGSAPTFTVFEDGEKVTYEITKDMYDALKPVSDSSILNTTFEPFNKISSFHRGVLTEYNPVFMLTNSIKDAQDVLINSQHPIKTYAKFGEAYAQITQEGMWYQEYMANGGEQNSYFNTRDDTFNTEPKGISKVLDTMPFKTISNLNNMIEMAPRLAEYIASREAGRSIEVSMLDAARVTTNFKAGGDVTKWANRNGATFLNASVQGAMQQVRNIREAHMNGLKGYANLAMKFAMAGIPAMILNSLLWGDDDDYEELSDYVKQNYWVLGKYGDGKFIRIPKGRMVTVIQEGLNQMKNLATGDDEADLGEFLKIIVDNIAPNNPIDNNVIAPFIQAKNNKTWYGGDLVPKRLQDVPEAQQYDETTDSFSKWLGDKINVSPYKINYLLNQYSGGIGDVVLPMMTEKAESGNDSLGSKLMAPLTDKFTVDSKMKNQNRSDLYELSDKLTKKANDLNATDEDKLKKKYIDSVSSDISELSKQQREIQADTTLSDSQKYNKVREIQEQINSMAKEARDNYENITVKSNYSKVNTAEYYKNNKGEWTKINDKEAAEINELGMSEEAKNTYFKTKNTINGIVNGYKESKGEIGIQDEESDEYKDIVSTLSKEKKNNIVSKIIDSGLNDKPKAYIYKKYYNSDKVDFMVDTGIKVDDYLRYTIQELESDKNANGKSISGSRKEKVVQYINSLNLDIPQKAIMIKATNTFKFNDYNNEIISYVNGLNMDYENKVRILEELDMTVSQDGKISWSK